MLRKPAVCLAILIAVVASGSASALMVDLPGTVALLGTGAALGSVAGLSWLTGRRIHYWGDIDTRSFVTLNRLRARSPGHGADLITWTDRFVATLDGPETADERRLRHAACLLSDIGWRAHPDYRGEQIINIITHAAFVGIDHPGRAYLALAVYFRHEGVAAEKASPMLRSLAGPRLFERARLLGALLRIAFPVSAGMEGALPGVVSGLVDKPVIAVPTSVGYGASFAGLAALLGMLNCCGSGVTVVNIDNGFGAACAADDILRLATESHGQ